ncbi:hypothetical protein [Streptomyces canus]|uniref:hypothetical protein n=1 Tax=Streptomyces canus TaxID=58343 RepID=UPI002788A8F3|nr:hypothetical protein [Streptomyces canus]MDQ0766356.1 hypothetical protein [Streptomyces canus]
MICSRGDEEIACGDSGSDGEHLLAANTDVFPHGSVRLPTDVAAECFRELRHQIRSPAEEYGRSTGMPTSLLFSRTEACSLVSASQRSF